MANGFTLGGRLLPWSGPGKQGRLPNHGRRPSAPTNQNAPQGLDGRPLPVENGKQEVDKQNQQEIRPEVQRLYAMAPELKDEVDRTNANAVLSLPVVKRAQDIEKLAIAPRDKNRVQ